MYRLEKGGYLRFLVSKGRAAQARVHLVPVAWCGAQDHDGDRLGSAQPKAPFAGLGDLTRAGSDRAEEPQPAGTQ
jgi:uncharacterized protein YllA (UPF0747 family)